MPEQIPAQSDILVVVARSASALHSKIESGPCVALLPDHDNWNDYGLQLFAKLHVISPNGQQNAFPVRLMFSEFPTTASVLEGLLNQFGDVFPIELIAQPFVSLLPDMAAYESFIELLGFDLGVAALRKLRDAVVARLEGDHSISKLVESENFHIGVLRNPSSYAAYRRGSKFFRRTAAIPVDDIAAPFVVGAKLPSARNPYVLKFDFRPNELFKDRIAVLIGRNGAGKTQLLNSIVHGLADSAIEGVDASPRARFFPKIQPGRVLVFSSVPTDPFPRDIGAWRGVDYEYFAVNASKSDGPDALLAPLLGCYRDDGEISFDSDPNHNRLYILRRSLEPIGLWNRLHLPLMDSQAEPLPGEISTELGRLFPIDKKLNELNTLRLVQQIDWERSPVVLDDRMRPRALSSGEYAMLRFAVQVSSAIEPGSLLLIDEPESHLHPNYVSALLETLHQLLEATGSIAVIATHSAYVVREAPRHKVSVLSLRDQIIQVASPRLQTFGASIDAISQFVFADLEVEHRYQQQLESWAKEVGREIGVEGVLDQFGADLNPESLSLIARTIRDEPG